MKRKFVVKVGEKTFPVEVEEVLEAAASRVERPVVVESKAAPASSVPEHEQKVEASVGAIRAPLPGKVVSVKCKAGDTVKTGDTVLVLESMKMENAIQAPKSGTVKEVSVAEGQTVALGDILFVIE
jgi:biotin carboxyl carrier protein